MMYLQVYEFDNKVKLDETHRGMLKSVMDRVGDVKFPGDMTLARFFKDATVEYMTQDEKPYRGDTVRPVYTSCVLECRGRRVVGIARLSQEDQWNAELGQRVAFVRAVRLYVVGTAMPVRLGKKGGQVRRTQKDVDRLLDGTVAPSIAQDDTNTTTVSTGVDITYVDVTRAKS